MHKILIEFREHTVEYHVSYSVTRAVQTMLSHTTFAHAEVDSVYYTNHKKEP